MASAAAAALFVLCAASEAPADIVCDPPAGGAEAFCVDATLPNLTDYPAASPVGLSFSLENVSTGLAANPGRGFHSAEINLKALSGGSGAYVTPSQYLQDYLLVAGEPGNGSVCTRQDAFVGCSAGRGDMLIRFPGVPQVTRGTFGVHRIYNRWSAARDRLVFDIEWCASYQTITLRSGFQDCSFNQREQVEVSDDGAGAGQHYFNVPLEVVLADGTAITAVSYAGEFAAQSSMLHDGTPATQTYSIARTTAACVPGRSTATLTARNGRRAQVTRDFTLSGCPTAATSFSISGLDVTFDPGASAVAPGSGRTLTRWHWSFGDGDTNSLATSAPFTHTYDNINVEPADPGPRTVVFGVTDSVGAHGETTFAIPASHTGLAVGLTTNYVRPHGTVTPSHQGGTVSVTFEKRQDGDWVTVNTKTDTLNAASEYDIEFNRPQTPKCRLTAKYKGSTSHFRSSNQKTVDC